MNLNNLLGRPWVLGAQGPEAFDCWSLARYVQAEEFGRELPEIVPTSASLLSLVRLVQSHPVRSSWVPVEVPSHGSLVEMSHGSHPHHIGVYLTLGGGGVLHCLAGQGVVFDPVLTLRAAGWRRMAYYDWAG